MPTVIDSHSRKCNTRLFRIFDFVGVHLKIAVKVGGDLIFEIYLALSGVKVRIIEIAGR